MNLTNSHSPSYVYCRQFCHTNHHYFQKLDPLWKYLLKCFLDAEEGVFLPAMNSTSLNLSLSGWVKSMKGEAKFGC